MAFQTQTEFEGEKLEKKINKAHNPKPLIRYHTGGYYTNWTIMG